MNQFYNQPITEKTTLVVPFASSLAPNHVRTKLVLLLSVHPNHEQSHIDLVEDNHNVDPHLVVLEIINDTDYYLYHLHELSTNVHTFSVSSDPLYMLLVNV